MSNKTLKQLTTEFTETAADDLYLMQRDSDSVTGKIKAKNAFGGGWSPIGGTLSVQSGYNKGNREFVIDTTEDLTSLISPGMRFKYTPTTTPPTQCADFESSNSQYATKSSPSGITFTDDFTCEAWIKLESYFSGGMAIVTRRSTANNGWGFELTSTGQLQIFGANSTSDVYLSYQSIPLNRWVHVAGTLDMSASTGKLYIDGVEVPGAYANGATTTISQAGDLRVGTDYTPAKYFDGKIADVRVWSAVRTATEIRDNMWSTLTGSETNLVAYFPLNGDFNDSTANNNHLTAAGSPVATATNSDTPMPSTMFGIFTKVTSSELTVFTGSDYGIMNDGFSTSYFSYQKVPFGFPTQRSKWSVEAMFTGGTYTYSATPNGTSVYSLSYVKLTIPIGAWLVKGQAHFSFDRSAGGTGSTCAAAVSTSTTTFSNPALAYSIAAAWSGSTAGTQTFKPRGMMNVQDYEDTTVATDYYIVLKAIQAGADLQLDTGLVPDTAAATTYPPAMIEAQCAYL